MFRYTAFCICAVFSMGTSVDAFADAPKCSDPAALSILKNQVDPLVDTAISVSAAASEIAKGYTTSYTNFYALSETENTRDCEATVTVTTPSDLTANTQVIYRVIATEDEKTLVALGRSFSTRGLIMGLQLDAIRKAQKTDQR